MSDNKKLFFGYGANRSRSKIKEIIGRDPGDPVGAIIEGYNLYFQTLKQIPNPAGKILRDLFGGSFKAFTIKKGDGLVGGVVWSFTDKDLEKMKEWEFVGEWREIVKVKVKSEDLYEVDVVTEKSIDSDNVENRVDGLLYNEFRFTARARDPDQDKYYSEQQIKKLRKLLSSLKGPKP